MANKNDVFVLARRRADGSEMVLGRQFIMEYPHLFEEVTRSVGLVKDIKIEKVPVKEEVVLEATDISMSFSTANGFTEPETIEEFRAVLDKLEVEYKPQHGLPGLKKLYEDNKD
jgi:hypothetical protein